MARTISCVAAVSLALAGMFVASPGFSPEPSILSSVSRSASLASRSMDSDLLDQRGSGAAVGLAGPASAPLARMTSAPLVGPVAPLMEAPARPQPRTFMARGPFVARVSDAAFGPKVRPDDLLLPDPPPTLSGASDLLCIAVATYHEARNQPLDGQLAVASVILNRTGAPERWGASPCEVVTPVQFSFLSSDGSYPPINDSEAWAIAVEMAREALERGPSPAIGEADHYHTTAVQPVWNNSMEQVVQIDDHVFFVDPSTQG